MALTNFLRKWYLLNSVREVYFLEKSYNYGEKKLNFEIFERALYMKSVFTC